MFCATYNDNLQADTGYIVKDYDDAKEMEALNQELQDVLSKEVESIISKLSQHHRLTDIIRKTVMQSLTITIDADREIS